MATFLDTLLRDSSAEGEHFCPLELPTFASAPARPPAFAPRMLEPQPRELADLIESWAGLPTFAGVDFVTALLLKSRPARDPDRFTAGLGLVAEAGEESDPFPVLF